MNKQWRDAVIKWEKENSCQVSWKAVESHYEYMREKSRQKQLMINKSAEKSDYKISR